jgi:hypothetical protein
MWRAMGRIRANRRRRALSSVTSIFIFISGATLLVYSDRAADQLPRRDLAGARERAERGSETATFRNLEIIEEAEAHDEQHATPDLGQTSAVDAMSQHRPGRPFAPRPPMSTKPIGALITANAGQEQPSDRRTGPRATRAWWASRPRSVPDQLRAGGGEAAAARTGQASVDGAPDDDGSPLGVSGRAVRHEDRTPWARGAIWRTRGYVNSCVMALPPPTMMFGDSDVDLT